MTDEELIARLRDAVSGEHDMTPHGADVLQAADRIEELIEESGRRLALARSEGVARVEQFERTEALTEQLAAARQDAKEAEAYAEELEKERDEARAAWEIEAATVKRFAERHTRHLVMGAEARDRAERAEAKLEEFRHALLWCGGSADFNEGGVAREGWLKVCAPLLEGESHD